MSYNNSMSAFVNAFDPNTFREEPIHISQLRFTDDKSICNQNPTCRSLRIVVPLMVQLGQGSPVTVDLVIHVLVLKIL